MDCFILSPSILGSFHIFFCIKFSNGAQWVLKVPATGHPSWFDIFDAKALTLEALTIWLIKRKTTIPIPEIYLFNASTQNDLGCHFILMEFIEAVLLHKIWFKEISSINMLEQRRAQILQDLAAPVVQLNQFVYCKGGWLFFDKNGNPKSIRPMKKLDISSMLDCQQTGNLDEFFVFCEVGLFTNSKEFLFCMLDCWPAPLDWFDHGIYKLL